MSQGGKHHLTCTHRKAVGQLPFGDAQILQHSPLAHVERYFSLSHFFSFSPISTGRRMASPVTKSMPLRDFLNQFLTAWSHETPLHSKCIRPVRAALPSEACC